MRALRGVVGVGLMVGALLAFWTAAASAAILYDQTDHPSTMGIDSDVFTDNHSADIQAADDFTVPPGQSWQISQVSVQGGNSGTPGSNVNLFIYANSGSLPGTERFHQLDITTTGSPNFVIPTNSPPLIPGTYWLSVQDTAGTIAANAWSWQSRTIQSGSHGAVFNPGGYFNSGACSTWQPSTCLGPGGDPDFLFRLDGTTQPFTPLSQPTTSSKPSNSFGFGGVTLNKDKGTATLSVNVPGPGNLSLGGKGIVAQRLARHARASAARSVGKAGTVTLLVKAKGKAKRKLIGTGKAKVKAKVTFTPTGGTAKTERKRITLKKTL